jgi:HEAT repeat protein
VKEMERSGGLDETLNHLMTGSTFEMLNAASAIKVYGDKAVERLIPALQDQDRETRWKAAVALEEVGAPAIQPLANVIQQGSHEAKVSAIWALEKIHDPGVVAPLIEELKDEDECCRWMAEASLKKIGDPEGVRAAEAQLAAESEEARGFVEELIEGS